MLNKVIVSNSAMKEETLYFVRLKIKKVCKMERKRCRGKKKVCVGEEKKRKIKKEGGREAILFQFISCNVLNLENRRPGSMVGVHQNDGLEKSGPGSESWL